MALITKVRSTPLLMPAVGSSITFTIDSDPTWASTGQVVQITNSDLSPDLVGYFTVISFTYNTKSASSISGRSGRTLTLENSSIFSAYNISVGSFIPDGSTVGPAGFGGGGTPGATGSQGFTGPQGFQGFQGEVGPQGFQGFQGEAGPQGFQGFQGEAGPQGFQGEAGPQGFQGEAGPQGFQGFQGFQGSTGAIEPITLNEVAFGTGTGLTSSPLFQFITSSGTNTISAASTRSAVIGGNGNNMDSYNSSIIGGYTNNLYSCSESSTLIGGNYNKLHYYSIRSGIIGGANNDLYQSNDSGIIGGSTNLIQSSGNSGLIGGYKNCMVQTNNSSIIGGQKNILCTSLYSNIIGGCENLMKLSNFSSIIGGLGNYMCDAAGSVIIGGKNISLYSNCVVAVPMLRTINLTQDNNSNNLAVFNSTANDLHFRPLSTILNGVSGTFSVSGATISTSNGLVTSISQNINVFKSTTDGATSSTNVQTLSSSQLITGGTYKVGDVLVLSTRARKVGAAGSITIRMYVNTTSSIGGATLVGTFVANALAVPMQRILVIKTTTNTEVMPAGTSLISDFATPSTVALSSLNIDWTTDKFIIFAVQDANQTDDSRISYYTIEKL